MTVELPPHYPHRWEVDVALADGGTVHVRPIRPDDAERLHRFHGRQSAQSIYFRFFSPRPQLSDRDVERFTNIDYDERMAFVALLAGEIIGVARYDAFGSDRRAEVAFFVDDAHHGRGLATLLLEYLAVAAKENGITGFMATVLPENREMIRVFRWAGFDVATAFADGVVEVTLGIEPTAEGVERIAERARLAEARSVARLLRPGSVAVVGASREPMTVGHEVLRCLLDGGFEGPVYPVNRAAHHVHSVRAYANVADVPDEVDVVVVAVPAAEVPAVVVDCARKHVEGLVVLSAAEHDDMSDWEELVTLARGHGMRLVGPASVGVVNNDPAVRLRATVAAGWPAAGTVAMSTQSGSVGATVLEMATEWGIGLSCFVNLGLKGDVSGNDLMQFWEDDPGTDVIVLYLESFGNPRKFFRIARRVGRSKPIVALHTSELAAPRPAPTIGRRFWPAAGTYAALLGQAGVIAVPTLAELFHVALLLESQPLPAGERVAVIANAAQPGLLAAEEARRAGLDVADLGPMGALDLGPAGALDRGPDGGVDRRPVGALDLGWRADADRYRAVLGDALARDDVDAAIVVFAPPVLDRAERVAAAVDEVALAAGKPVVATFLGDRLENMPGHGDDRSGGRRPDGRRAHRVPRFRFPEQGARALGHVARYSRWRSEPEGEPPAFVDLDLDRASEVVAAALDRSPAGGPLPLADALAVLRAGGIGPVGQVEVTSCSDTLSAAAELGYPVALKAGVRPRFARSEETGLALGLHTPDELAETYQRMRDTLGPAMDAAIVQAMAPVGLDVQVVAHQDTHLGPLVALGRGGAAGSTPEELVVRLVPLTKLDARRLVAASPVEELLQRLESDDAAVRLEELLLRVSTLVEAVPDLAEIRLDPVLVSAGALAVTDLTVLVAPFVSPLGPAVRRLG